MKKLTMFFTTSCFVLLTSVSTVLAGVHHGGFVPDPPPDGRLYTMLCKSLKDNDGSNCHCFLRAVFPRPWRIVYSLPMGAAVSLCY